MNSFKSVSTRQSHSEGRRLSLKLGSTVTPHWVHVLGQDSDLVQASHKSMKRIIGERVEEEHNKGKGEGDHGAAWLKSPEGVAFMEEQQLVLVAGWFNAWSFDEPCTEDNKIAFLRENPTFTQQIDNYSGNFDNFSGDTKPNS